MHEEYQDERKDAETEADKGANKDSEGESIFSPLFPLFQPCGDAYPDAVVPRPFQWVGRGLKDSHGVDIKGKELNKRVLTAFEGAILSLFFI